MLKNAKNSTFLDRFVSLDSIGEYLLNTVSENSTIQEHSYNIHFIGGCCGEKKFFFNGTIFRRKFQLLKKCLYDDTHCL
jgi:hypothetical protein